MKFVFNIAFSLMALSFMFEKSLAKHVQASNQSPVNIIQSILKDPEFLSLDAEKQLNVIIMIHDMLVGYYESKFKKKKNVHLNEKNRDGF